MHQTNTSMCYCSPALQMAHLATPAQRVEGRCGRMHSTADSSLLRYKQQLGSIKAEHRAQSTWNLPRQLHSNHLCVLLFACLCFLGCSCCCWHCVRNVVEFTGAVVAVHNTKATCSAWEVQGFVRPRHCH